MNLAFPSVAGSGTYRVDAATDRWQWSPEIYDLHGLPPTVTPTTELLASHMHPDDRAATLELLSSVLEHGGTFSCTYRLRSATGREVTALFLGESYADVAAAVHGAPARTGKGVAGFLLDISEPLAQAATEAVQASARNRASIEQVKGALMVTYGLDQDAAFAVLRRFSNHHNIRLATLAEAIATRMASVRGSGSAPEHSLLALLAEVTGEDQSLADSPHRHEPRVADEV